MKRIIVLSFAVFLAQQLTAQEINSGVIHNYKYVGAGYGYMHDLIGSVDAHGGVAEVSYDIDNILLGVSGGYFATERGGVDLWSIAGHVGYVARLAENRVNVIPRVGIGYSEVSGGGFSGDSTALLPGVTVSFAINNRVSINGSYTYAYDIDTEADAHGFGLGTRIAVAEQVGLVLGVSFSEDADFTGGTAGVTFHF